MIGRSTLHFLPLSLFLACRFSSLPQRYSERPFVAEGWVGQRSGVRDFLQGGWLMARGVVPFSYDGYQRLCVSAVQNQAKLTKEDLMMIMQLGIEYRVRLAPFCHYLQNEIHLRIHKDYELQIQQYDELINTEIKGMTAQMEQKMKFYQQFFKEENEEDEQEIEQTNQNSQNQTNSQVKTSVLQPINTESNTTNKPEQKISNQPNEPNRNNKTDKSAQQLIVQMTQQLKQRSQREFSLSDVLKVADLLREWRTQNLALIEYLQQLLTIKLQGTQVEAAAALSYLRFLTFACQSLMKEYQSHPQKYTARSIKRIYKYQYLYFQEHLRQLITSDPTATPSFLESVIRQYAAFPIKRRSLRNKIAIYTSSQINKLGLADREDLKTLLVDINGTDNKMKTHYRTLLGLPEPTPKPIVQNNAEKEQRQTQKEGNNAQSMELNHEGEQPAKAQQQQSR